MRDRDINIPLACKEPTNLSNRELEEILEAQLTAVRYLRKMFASNEEKQTSAAKKVKNHGIKRHNLKNINNRI